MTVLLCKHEDLSLEPRDIEKPAVVYAPVTPALGIRDWYIPRACCKKQAKQLVNASSL